MHILIVEDEVKLSSAIRKGLESEGYSVSIASTGEEGFFLISNQKLKTVCEVWKPAPMITW